MNEGNPQFGVPADNSLLYLSTGFLGLIFTVIIGFAIKFWLDEKNAKERSERAAELDRNLHGNINRRHPRPANNDSEGSEEEDDADEIVRDTFGKKIGTKKLAKLQAKQEARAAREAMLADREERKKKEEEERKVREAAEKAEEDKAREEELERKRLAEEKAAKEHEEYLKLKEAFAVEEEGFDEVEEEDAANLKQQFIDYCKQHKVVNVDDLASFFKIKVSDVGQRINDLIQTEELNGVIDDRGKFIYISPEEFESVARFVRQRGRITLSDLVDQSNRLISLQPVNSEAS